MPPMPSRPILARVALLTWLLVGLVVLADSVARQELRQAIGGTTVASAVTDTQPVGASDD
jgi:hypothetical protein